MARNLAPLIQYPKAPMRRAAMVLVPADHAGDLEPPAIMLPREPWFNAGDARFFAQSVTTFFTAAFIFFW